MCRRFWASLLPRSSRPGGGFECLVEARAADIAHGDHRLGAHHDGQRLPQPLARRRSSRGIDTQLM